VSARTAGSAGASRLDNLTGLRAFAAAWVMAHHYWGAAAGPQVRIGAFGYGLDVTDYFAIGFLGVDVFFVLSGFVLALPTSQAGLGLRPPQRVSTFFRRRAFRVLPAYYVQLLVLLPLAAYGIGKAMPTTIDTLLHTMMAHNLWEDFTLSIRPIYWTLPVEADFYLIFPLLALCLAPRRLLPLLAGALAIAVTYRLIIFHHFYPARAHRLWLLQQLPGRLDQFVMGMVASFLYVRTRPTPRSGGAFFLAGVAGVVSVVGLMGSRLHSYMHGDWSLFVWQSIVGACIAMVVYGAAAGCRLANALLGNPVTIALGVISYSLYLWHTVVLDGFVQSGAFEDIERHRLLLVTAWSVPPTIAISAASYWWVERPFLRASHDERAGHSRGNWPTRPGRILALCAGAIVTLAFLLNAFPRSGAQ
jgi:peptidoglycan/LPS O-acetylase OafA/YrhL